MKSHFNYLTLNTENKEEMTRYKIRRGLKHTPSGCCAEYLNYWEIAKHSFYVRILRRGNDIGWPYSNRLNPEVFELDNNYMNFELY